MQNIFIQLFSLAQGRTARCQQCSPLCAGRASPGWPRPNAAACRRHRVADDPEHEARRCLLAPPPHVPSSDSSPRFPFPPRPPLPRASLRGGPPHPASQSGAPIRPTPRGQGSAGPNRPQRRAGSNPTVYCQRTPLYFLATTDWEADIKNALSTIIPPPFSWPSRRLQNAAKRAGRLGPAGIQRLGGRHGTPQ